jgi:hypothetical protein
MFTPEPNIYRGWTVIGLSNVPPGLDGQLCPGRNLLLPFLIYEYSFTIAAEIFEGMRFPGKPSSSWRSNKGRAHRVTIEKWSKSIQRSSSQISQFRWDHCIAIVCISFDVILTGRPLITLASSIVQPKRGHGEEICSFSSGTHQLETPPKQVRVWFEPCVT